MQEHIAHSDNGAADADNGAADATVDTASQLRRGMHLLAGREVDADVLQRASAALREIFDTFESSPARVRNTTTFGQRLSLGAPADGEPFPDSLLRPIGGSGNPFSVPLVVYRDGDCVTATATLGDAFEGAPGRSHGGVVAAIFDDVFGSVPMMQGKIAFTASLTINYVSPSPVREPVTFRAWIDRVEGKKLFIEGDAHHGDTLVTTASALFIDATEFMLEALGATGESDG